MFERAWLSRKFELAVPYDRYVAGGKPEQRAAWLKTEIDTHAHFSVFGFRTHGLAVTNPRFKGNLLRHRQLTMGQRDG